MIDVDPAPGLSFRGRLALGLALAPAALAWLGVCLWAGIELGLAMNAR